MKKITSFLFMCLLAFTGFAQGHETFANSTLSETATSYTSGSFVGNNGVTWTFVNSRGDKSINGKSIMLGRNQTPTAELTSDSIANGIGTLSFKYQQAYSTDVNLEVSVNGQLVYTATSSNENGVVKNTGAITVNTTGKFVLQFYNPNGGQVVIDDIEWTTPSSNPVITINSPQMNEVLPPLTDSVQIDFEVNNFTLSTSATAADGDGYITYQMDGDTPTNYFSTDSIVYTNLSSGTHSFLMSLVDNSGNLIVIDTVVFSIPNVTGVSSIGALRNATQGEYYTLTSEVVLTFQQDFRGQKYIQDASGAILIDDADGIITTSYNRYDGITGLSGKLQSYNGTLQFVPIADPGAASSTGNAIDPVVLTIADFMANPEAYESQIIAFKDVQFEDADGSLTFSTGSNYTVSDANGDSTIMRTNFYDANYIDSIIPQGVQDALVGIAAHYNGDGQFYMRDMDDLNAVLGIENFTKTDVSLYPNPATNRVNIQVEGQAQVAVYSILGQRVMHTTLKNKGTLNIAQLKAGIYLVRIQKEAQVVTKKLIVE